jgi:hypothetical protein
VSSAPCDLIDTQPVPERLLPNVTGNPRKGDGRFTRVCRFRSVQPPENRL